MRSSLPLFWMVHTIDDAPAVFIQDARALIYARLAASCAGLPGTFLEAHALDAKTARKVPKAMTGRVLSQKEAAALLRRLGED